MSTFLNRISKNLQNAPISSMDGKGGVECWIASNNELSNPVSEDPEDPEVFNRRFLDPLINILD